MDTGKTVWVAAYRSGTENLAADAGDCVARLVGEKRACMTAAHAGEGAGPRHGTDKRVSRRIRANCAEGPSQTATVKISNRQCAVAARS